MPSFLISDDALVDKTKWRKLLLLCGSTLTLHLSGTRQKRRVSQFGRQAARKENANIHFYD